MTIDTIRVWAPAVAAVDVLISPVTAAEPRAKPERHAMTAQDGGWWAWTPPPGTTGPLDY
jgi:maltooligosyltrehalose trehalohydrolase